MLMLLLHVFVLMLIFSLAVIAAVAVVAAVASVVAVVAVVAVDVNTDKRSEIACELKCMCPSIMCAYMCVAVVSTVVV